MNRRQAIGTTLKAAAVASVLRTARAAAQDTGEQAPANGSTLHVNPVPTLVHTLPLSRSRLMP
jgi:hypothetical protein